MQTAVESNIKKHIIIEEFSLYYEYLECMLLLGVKVCRIFLNASTPRLLFSRSMCNFACRLELKWSRTNPYVKFLLELSMLVPFQLLGMTSCGISLLTSYQRFVMMCALSHTFSPLLGNLCHIPLPTLKRMPAWMLGHVAFGDYDNRVHFLM